MSYVLSKKTVSTAKGVGVSSEKYPKLHLVDVMSDTWYPIPPPPPPPPERTNKIKLIKPKLIKMFNIQKRCVRITPLTIQNNISHVLEPNLPKLVSPVSQADERIFLISNRILAKCCHAQRNSCARQVFRHIFINHYLN